MRFPLGEMTVGDILDRGLKLLFARLPVFYAVNLLVQTVALNYMALHGQQGAFAGTFPTHGLGGTQQQDSLIAFAPIV